MTHGAWLMQHDSCSISHAHITLLKLYTFIFFERTILSEVASITYKWAARQKAKIRIFVWFWSKFAKYFEQGSHNHNWITLEPITQTNLLVCRSLILSTYYGNFINVRWFLIVQLIENSVFSSPKIFKTELVLRFLQIAEKPIQKMIQERLLNLSMDL